ncbi:MAG: biotin--[acetyl-CoA-carboxylase] ligase [Chloroflexota bacterium]|nr:biotin--[acetyl-CoA-carboxylase] ligase [Chloroflexota bacterium]
MNQSQLEKARKQLRTERLGWPLQFFSSVTSTQEIVREQALTGAPEGLVVVANQQTAGKGRAGREWWSPPSGGLYLSILLRPNVAPGHLSWLTICLALGAAEAIEDICQLRPDIKWPNDLELHGKKLAGILCEGAFQGTDLEFVVAGLGLNINQEFSNRPELAATATSLLAERVAKVDEADLLAAILKRIEAQYTDVNNGISPVPRWASRLITLGQVVEIRRSGGDLRTGRALGVLPDGALRLQLDSGEEEIIRAEDVTVLNS